MLRKSVFLVSFIFILSLAIIGCGGGGGNPTGPDLPAAATASLSGTVIFDDAPLANAAVYLYKSEKAHTIGMAQLPALRGSLLAQQVISDGAYSTTTNAAGLYNFVDIPVGQYTLIAIKDENHQFAQTGVLLGAVTTLNPQLTPTGKISGKVTVTIGTVEQNVAGAFVYISGTSYIALTDSAGNFVINNVPSNALTTTAAYEVMVIAGQGTAASKTGIRVDPGATTNVGTFALSSPTTSYVILSGALTPGSGVTSADLAEQFIILTRQEDASIIGVHSDSSGNFQFSVTKTGTYLVMGVDDNYNYSPDPLTVNVTTLDNSTITLTSITVNAAEIANTGSIIGQVTSAGPPVAPAGSPVAGAIVNVVGTSLLGVSDVSGNFVIEKVPANTAATPYTVEISSSRGTAPAKTGVIVNVGQSTTENFAIALPTAGYKNIVGTLTPVLPVTQAMLNNRLVQLTAPDGKVSAAYSNASGGFSFLTTQTGAHNVNVMDVDFAYDPRTQSITVVALDNATMPLGAINATNPDFKVNVTGTLVKAVKIKPEINESGVSVFLTQIPSGNPRFNTFTNDTGSFTFMVPPGTYSLSIGSPYKLDDPIIGDPIVIAADYTYPGSFLVRPLGTINSIVEGTVTWAAAPAGWVITDGEVVLQNQAGTPALFERRVVNPTAANFRFESVPPGNYTLTTDPAKNGYQSPALNVAVVEGTDNTGLALSTTFVAPFIGNAPAPGVIGNVLTLTGETYFASTQALVNGLSLPATGSWTLPTIVKFDIGTLVPGSHSVQLVNTVGSVKVNGNIAAFFKPVAPPTITATSTTDNSATVTWQNAPFVNEVEVELWTVSPVAQVGGVSLTTSQSFTFSNLLANTQYQARIRSRYNNVVSPQASAVFTTKQFSAKNPELMTLIGSNAYANLAGVQIFGFELMNNKTYVAYYEAMVVYVKAYDAAGNDLGTTFSRAIASAVPLTMFDFCVGGNSAFLLYPNSGGTLEIQKLSETLVADPVASATFGFGVLPSASQAKIEFHGGNLFVSSIYFATTKTLSVNRLDSNLLNPLLVHTGENALNSASGYWIQTVADELSNDLYIAVATSATPLAAGDPTDIEILRKPLATPADAATPLAMLPVSAAPDEFITEFKVRGTELIINSTFTDPYQIISRSNGYYSPLSPSGNLSSFGTDASGRLWAFQAAGSARYLINIDNGQVVNSIKVYAFANESGGIANPREFIKRQIGGTVTGKFGMLHKKSDGNLSVFNYDSSL